MGAIIAWLAGHWITGALKGFAGEVWGLVRHHTKDVLLAILAGACLWLWTGWSGEKAKHHSDMVALWAASEQNRAATEAQRAIETAAAKLEAQNAQADFEADQAPVAAATDRHVADWLRTPPPSVCPSRTVSEAGIAGVRPEVPADPRLADGAAAMRGFAAASTYALELRRWALRITGNAPAPTPTSTPQPPQGGNHP